MSSKHLTIKKEDLLSMGINLDDVYFTIINTFEVVFIFQRQNYGDPRLFGISSCEICGHKFSKKNHRNNYKYCSLKCMMLGIQKLENNEIQILRTLLQNNQN